MKKSYKKPLKHFTISRELFNKVLEFWKERIIIKTKDQIIDEYYYGNPDRYHIFYNGTDMMGLPARYVDAVNNQPPGTHQFWYQIIVNVKEDQKETEDMIDSKKEISGQLGFRMMLKRLKKYYSLEEIVTELNKYKYDRCCKTVTYETVTQRNEIVKWSNCYYWDINSAYASALCVIFPKAKDMIYRMYLERKTKHPEYKQVFNYFVGYLCKDNTEDHHNELAALNNNNSFRETFNWITKYTDDILHSSLDKCGGYLIYANTDGFIVSNPNKTIDASKQLGKFKEEYHGDVYTCRTQGYWCSQYGEEIKGNVRISLRNLIDLSKGKTVTYDREYVTFSDGTKTGAWTPVNIEQKTFNIIEME